MNSSSRFETQECALGLLVKREGVIALFGDRRATEAAVKAAFPQLNFRYLRQTHSSIVVKSSAGDPPEADAHWTRERGVALAIRTADCAPALIASRADSAVAAVHAGWRGLESEIILKTGVALLAAGSAPPECFAMLGPSIGPSSFEAGVDVAQRLEATFAKARFDQRETSFAGAHPDPAKRYVDLRKIALAQIRASGVPTENVFAQDVDTFINKNYWSFRRDAAQAGRQISFIARL